MGVSPSELRPKAADEIAVRSRGIPRIANRLLRRVRDVTDSPSPKMTAKVLAKLGVDRWGGAAPVASVAVDRHAIADYDGRVLCTFGSAVRYTLARELIP